MELWQIILLAALVIVFIPTYMLMRSVEELKKQGDSAELQKKQRQLKWCMGLLIVIFLITLGITMFNHYTSILANL